MHLCIKPNHIHNTVRDHGVSQLHWGWWYVTNSPWSTQASQPVCGETNISACTSDVILSTIKSLWPLVSVRTEILEIPVKEGIHLRSDAGPLPFIQQVCSGKLGSRDSQGPQQKKTQNNNNTEQQPHNLEIHWPCVWSSLNGQLGDKIANAFFYVWEPI